MHFIFDVDGTICFDGQTIAPSIVEALERLQAAGHDVVFASARPIRDLLPVLPKAFHQNVLIGGNGAFTSVAGHIATAGFDAQTAAELKALIVHYNCTYLADGQWDYAYTGPTAHPIFGRIHHEAAQQCQIDQLQPLTKLVLFQTNDALQQALAELPVTVHYYESEQLLDISPQFITKAHAVARLHIAPYVAFGNDANDASLFQQAHYSVCVGTHAVGQNATMRIPQRDIVATIDTLCEQFKGE